MDFLGMQHGLLPGGEVTAPFQPSMAVLYWPQSFSIASQRRQS
ncbi:MAG TPA: hypothetical protein VK812_17130 [Candidatus Binatus sp.]|nr:hypothetical protein [Candidatus Binatus sp.]